MRFVQACIVLAVCVAGCAADEAGGSGQSAGAGLAGVGGAAGGDGAGQAGIAGFGGGSGPGGGVQGGSVQGGSGQGGSSGQSGAAGEACGGQTARRLRGAAEVAEGGSEGLLAQACMTVEFGGLCLAPKPVGADGVYDQSIEPDGIECVKRMAVRVASTAPRRATVYCEAAAVGGGEFVAGNARLPRVEPALEVPPEGSVAEERTVRFEGVEVQMVPERLLPEQASYGELAGGPVEGEGLCFAPPSLGLVGLYAFWPESDITGGFGFRVENKSGLAPGTRVVFRVLGGLYCSLTEDEVIPEGEFAVIGEGEVDVAGEYVVPDAGVTLPCLSWLGYSVAP